MSHHMAVVYKHAIISIIFTTFYMTIAFPHITLICTSYLSLLTRKHSKVGVLASSKSERVLASTREYSLRASGGTLTRGWYCTWLKLTTI